MMKLWLGVSAVVVGTIGLMVYLDASAERPSTEGSSYPVMSPRLRRHGSGVFGLLSVARQAPQFPEAHG